MRVLIVFLIIFLLTQNLHALTPSERSALLDRVKKTKSMERNVLTQRIARFKHSKNIRSTVKRQHFYDTKMKKRIKQKQRLIRARKIRRVP